jgi:hypothetical protein
MDNCKCSSIVILYLHTHVHCRTTAINQYCSVPMGIQGTSAEAEGGGGGGEYAVGIQLNHNYSV